VIRLACSENREFKIESAGSGRVALTLEHSGTYVRAIMSASEVRHLIAILETVRAEAVEKGGR
jgi:hypothetical protein